MFSKCLALTLCICCLITTLKLEELEALPVRLEAIGERSGNTEGVSKNSKLAENLRENLKETSHTPLMEITKESEKVADEIEALPVLADRGVRKVRSMFGLASGIAPGIAPGIRFYPLNGGYPEESKARTRKPKKLRKSKNRRPATTEALKMRANEEGKNTNPHKELTISIPSFKTDSFGKRVYNPWGATFGKVWMDTRFHVNHQSRMPRLHLESDPGMAYYPDNEVVSTVCQGRSTVYNKPEVYEFLRAKRYKKPHTQRPIHMVLRRELYRMARSEECHSRNLTDFMAYQICALQRNQRMEYMLPHYPRQQLR